MEPIVSHKVLWYKSLRDVPFELNGHPKIEVLGIVHTHDGVEILCRGTTLVWALFKRDFPRRTMYGAVEP